MSLIDLAPVVESERWPTVTGTIISSLDLMEAIAVASGKSGPHPVRQKRLRLLYDYDVHGGQYQSSRVNMIADYVSAPNRGGREKYATGPRGRRPQPGG